MEPLSFLSPSADNLFKFLFLNGLVMIALGMFYPLQKSNEIELQILNYNKKIELLNQDIESSNQEIISLNKTVEDRIKLSNNLVEKRKGTKVTSEIIEYTSQINEMKLKTNVSFQEIKNNQSKVDKNLIIADNEKLVILELKSQLKTYDSYCTWFFIIGIVLSILGLVGWLISTFFSEHKNYHDFLERRNTNKKQKATIVSKSDVTEPSSSVESSTSQDTPPINSDDVVTLIKDESIK